MPQLDLITFFPQFFWCFFGFFGFFLSFSYFIIPSIATILKFRRDKLVLLANGINSKKDGSARLLVGYDNIIYNAFQEITNFLTLLNSGSSNWATNTLLKLNTTHIVLINQRFLKNSFEKFYIK